MKTIKKPVPAYVKCNCGHVAKDHFQKTGCCNFRTQGGICGCTWYWPNDRWILKQKKKYGKTFKFIFRK